MTSRSIELHRRRPVRSRSTSTIDDPGARYSPGVARLTLLDVLRDQVGQYLGEGRL